MLPHNIRGVMIRVVDAMCGSGKSTAIFKMIRDNPDSRYMYITPFLSEIEDRLPEQLPDVKFHTPNNTGKGKTASFLSLIQDGYNVASTHKLFSMLTPEIVDILLEMDYHLIIDEAIDCVGLLPQEFKESDTKALLKGEFVIVDKEARGRLSWNEDKYSAHDGRYAKVRSMCNLGMLYCYADTFLMWEYPPKLLSGLSNIHVLTYLFSGSDMKGWLDLNKIPYEYVPHKELGLRDERELKKIVRDNLEILSNRNLDNSRQQNETLSASWYKNANADSINKYKAMLRSTVIKYKTKSGDVFWTTFKSHANRMAGGGYANGVKDNFKGKAAFLPCNIRATNDYKDYWLCMYAINKFKNPIEVNYMRDNGVSIDEESYALAEMIQFIFRGCIREGKTMKVLILSKRMRKLLEDWLET